MIKTIPTGKPGYSSVADRRLYLSKSIAKGCGAWVSGIVFANAGQNIFQAEIFINADFDNFCSTNIQ
jgi:hypothetical protein